MNRLEIVNRALIATGNSPSNVPDDGSDEWLVGEVAFDRAMGLLLERHPWSFATETAELVRLADSSLPGWQHVYLPPADSFHIRTIYYGGAPLRAWRLVGGKVHTHVDPVSALYVRDPHPNEWSATFTEALTRYVEAFTLRALNEDNSEATRREASAEAMLQEAKTVGDQQGSGRVFFRSRGLARRRGAPRIRIPGQDF